MDLFEYEKIGPEILQSSKIEGKMALLLMQKGVVYIKLTSAGPYMIQLTFVYILYSL